MLAVPTSVRMSVLSGEICIAMSNESHQFLCVYGHFYQPPREDPFTGVIPTEPGATPYENFNEKIAAECYEPNAAEGNFTRISFDVGPTLMSWLERERTSVYAAVLAADQHQLSVAGVGSALAQPYIHSILPLATPRDRRTLIAWGWADFHHHYGRPPLGMWLPETAVDIETLDLLVAQGIQYTVLAPWQAAQPIDPTEPYLVLLPSGRDITVFFYNSALSGAVSFDDVATIDADVFAASQLMPQLHRGKLTRGEDQLLLIASDGEVYGHHKPWRDRFLERLVQNAAATRGFQMITLGEYLTTHPATRHVTLRAPSTWSCSHGLARWSTGCTCTAGDASWKPALRRALDRLAVRLDDIFAREVGNTVDDPWEALDHYIGVHEGWQPASQFMADIRTDRISCLPAEDVTHTLRLFAAQYWGECMYTSCGLFIDDLDRIEPRNDIAFARRAISLAWQVTGENLQADFMRYLALAQSWRTGRTGADIYRQLPDVPTGSLPDLSAG